MLGHATFALPALGGRPCVQARQALANCSHSRWPAPAIQQHVLNSTSFVSAQYYGQGGLSMGAGAGIAIGVIAFVGVLLAFAALWRRRTSRCAMRPFALSRNLT